LFIEIFISLFLDNNKWADCPDIGKEIYGIAFHKACLVLSPQRKEVNLFKMGEFKQDEKIQKVKEEGIYFFGGRNEGGEPLGTLRILKIGILISFNLN